MVLESKGTEDRDQSWIPSHVTRDKPRTSQGLSFYQKCASKHPFQGFPEDYTGLACEGLGTVLGTESMVKKLDATGESRN